MEQVINILIALGGVGFFGWLIMTARKENKSGPKDSFDPFTPSDYKFKAPDPKKIQEVIKNETPEESTNHVNDLLNDLFPGD